MKNKRWLLVLLATLFLCLMTSSSVFAEGDEKNDTSGNISDLIDIENPVGKFVLDLFGEIYDLEYEPHKYMDDPKENKDGGVPLEIKKYPVERYMVNNEDTSGIFGFNLYAINNLFMGIIQNVVKVTDSSLELFTLNKLDEFADDIESISGDVYNTLKMYFAEILFAFLCAYLVFIFFAKGNARESFRKFMLFVVVLVVAGYWMSNASFLMKSMNALSSEMQGYLVEAGNGVLGIFSEQREGVYEGINTIDKDEKIEGTIAVMRNVYFDLALKRPYLLINYGVTKEKEINGNDKIKDLGFGFQNYPRVERMLAFKLNSEGSAYRIGHAYLEVNKNGNTNMASGSAFKQSGLVFLTFFIVIGLSIPFLLLGLINFALQLLAVFVALVLPFAFVLSFIPHFAMTGFKTLGKLVTIFLIKAMLGIFLFIMYLLAYSMYLFVKPTDTGMYLLHVVLLIILFFFIIAKRNKIISFITAGRVQTVDGNIMPNMNQYYSNQFSNAKRRLERRRTQKRTSPMNEGGEESDTKQNAKTNRTSMKEERRGTENGKDMNTKRTPQSKEEKATPVPLKTDSPSLERKEQNGNKGKEVGGNYKQKTDLKNQSESRNERDTDGVKKDNDSHTKAARDTEHEVERNKHFENINERKIDGVRRDNKTGTETRHDTGYDVQRNRELSSVEERKKERDEA